MAQLKHCYGLKAVPPPTPSGSMMTCQTPPHLAAIRRSRNVLRRPLLTETDGDGMTGRERIAEASTPGRGLQIDDNRPDKQPTARIVAYVCGANGLRR